MKRMQLGCAVFVVGLGIFGASPAHADEPVTYTPLRPQVTYTPITYVTYYSVAAAPRPRLTPFSPELRTAGIVTVGLGSAAVLVGGSILIGQALADVNRVHCTGGSPASFSLWGPQSPGIPPTCTNTSGPPKAVGFAGLGVMSAGVATGLVGASFMIVGGRRVSADVSPTGGSLRVAF